MIISRLRSMHPRHRMFRPTGRTRQRDLRYSSSATSVHAALAGGLGHAMPTRTTRLRDRQRQHGEQVLDLRPASWVTGTMLAVDGGMDGLRLRSGK